MRILIVTPEANPFARSGGLAEVIFGLACALVRLGHQVNVVMPLYRQVRESGLPLKFTGQTLSIPLSWKNLDAEIYHSRIDDQVDFYFIGQDALYNREGLYGTEYGDFEDNAERFIFFSRAVVEMVEALELDLDICHCHEWQTGLVPVYLRTLYHERPRLSPLPVLYTVHNVGYQGIFSAYDLPLTGLGWELLSPKALEFYGKINFMKGGLVFADLISTVSNKYREEILTPEFGFGLEGLFQERAAELFGILEGVDYQRWDPSRDTCLAATYDRQQLEGKQACKAALLKHFSLDLPLTHPLLGMTTRLFERKGIDLLTGILDDLLQLEVGFVLQGTGEERHHYLLQEISLRYPERFGLSIGYSEELARQIIAGSDIFLMPSRYEPCGLDQLYCLRYGTVPVVRATGGLDQTIQEYDPKTGDGNGFKFNGYTPAEFLSAIHQALGMYKDRKAWQALMRKNMALDFSWDTVAPKYLDLYRLAQEKR
ncbi:MAG: glycogen/starch synthase [Thermodesulfobacteriota bacterium]